ncbi:hypothetical protein L6R52_01835 [Myxococcota bacterium]|nr:hypothetical protein [Myxococcota bacterium]
MMQGDGRAAAEEAAKHFLDRRARVFHDPERLLGRAAARGLGWSQHVAWDVHFVYPRGVRWPATDVIERLPPPPVWFHQLKDREAWERLADAELGTSDWVQCLDPKSEADPARFRTGPALAEALSHALGDALRTPA